MSFRSIIPKNWQNKYQERSKDLSPIGSMRQELDHLFDHWSQRDPWKVFKQSAGLEQFNPSVDVEETKDSIIVNAELPGLEKDDVKIELSNGTLTIEGEKEQKTKTEDSNYFYHERSYGSFYRKVTLPCEVDKDNIEASFSKGVLNILLPKTEEVKQDTKEIEIS